MAENPPPDAPDAPPSAPDSAPGAPPGAPGPAPGPAPGAPPPPPPGPKIRKPLGRPQTPAELDFYARNFHNLSIVAVVFFPPLGLLGLYYSNQTQEANQESDWEDAYKYSNRTVWVDVFSILAGLGIIYALVLLV